MAGATAAGIAIGSVAGPIGTVVGGILGAGVDIFNWFTGQQSKTSQEQLANDQSLATIQAQKGEAQVKAGAYQDFLSKIPVAGEALTGTTGDLAFDQQYRDLLSNYGDVNVMAGMTGRVAAGSTGAALGKQAEDLMGGFVEAERKKAQGQLDILNTSIDSLNAGAAAIQDVKANPDLGTQIVQGVEKAWTDLNAFGGQIAKGWNDFWGVK